VSMLPQCHCVRCGSQWGTCLPPLRPARDDFLLSSNALEVVIAEQHSELAKLRADLETAAKLLRDAYNRGIQHHVVWAKKPCALELRTASKESPLKCTCGVWELDARIAAFLEHHEPTETQGGGSAGRSE
jgi:hypothetical protein